MYRLMVVDDEIIMRKAVITLVKKYLPEITGIYEAESGKEAIAIARENKPDIICMDIKMQGVDGVVAIKEIKKSLPNTIILVISALDEFKIAKTVMNYGIKSYLLKPLDKDEFVKAIHTALEEKKATENRLDTELELQECVSILKEVQEREIAYALIMGDVKRVERLHYFANDTYPDGGAVIVIKLSEEKDDTYMLTSGYNRLYSKLKAYIIDKDGIVSNIFRDQIVVFLFSYVKNGLPTSRKKMEVYRVKILELLDDIRPLKASVSVGPFVKTLEELKWSYHIALQPDNIKQSETIQVKEFDESPIASEYGYPIVLEKKIFKYIEEAQPEKALSELNKLLESVSFQTSKQVNSHLMMFAVALSHLRIEKKLDDSIDHSLAVMDDNYSLLEWCRFSIKQTIKDLQSQKETRANGLVEEAIRVIKKKYHEPITLNDISEHVNISTYYFTKIFKKSTGRTFVDYLNSYRIDIAKDLLISNRSLKISEISKKVGYSDQQYFNRSFKERTGLTPAEYRSQKSSI